ncbi:hypothetical protein [Legionella sp.]|uniref:hypothetical protein n=1 Tax=Legionella sp. TaxID=459 RepID=UPI003D152041
MPHVKKQQVTFDVCELFADLPVGCVDKRYCHSYIGTEFVRANEVLNLCNKTWELMTRFAELAKQGQKKRS